MTFLERVLAIMPRGVVAAYTGHNCHDTFMIVTNVKFLFYLISALKNLSFFRCRVLSDIVVVDYPNRPSRFELVYVLLSVKYQVRVLVKCFVGEVGMVDSVETLFYNANGHEREAGDLYGILFAYNSDLRRILTDYGFDGFPLRKDFPLIGYWQLRFDDELQTTIYEPVVMAQEYRVFTFNSPWEETTTRTLTL